MNKEQLIKTISSMCDVIDENKMYLTKLDAEIGDADHGINMDRAFSLIRTHISTYNDLSISQIFLDVSKALMSACAGTSGPLYGLLFKAAGKHLVDKEEITIDDLAIILENGINKIQDIAGATEGEKTMLDAMYPALRALKDKKGINDHETMFLALEETKRGLEATINRVATKGRASYLGERSIGHQDPGATSFTMLFECVCKNI